MWGEWLPRLPLVSLFGLAMVYLLGRAIVGFLIIRLIVLIFGQDRYVVRHSHDAAQIRSETIANIKVNLLDGTALALILGSGIIVFHSFQWSRFFLGFGLTYAIFEVWFYGTHRLLHTRPFMKWHVQHHRSRVTHALSALSLSLPEKTLNIIGMLLLPSLLTHFIAIPVESLLVYHFYNFLVNVLGHSNVEILPKRFASTWMGKWMVTTTYHSLHHWNGRAHFGLFTTFMDRAFGTVEPKYATIFDDVTHGKPLESKRAG